MRPESLVYKQKLFVVHSVFNGLAGLESNGTGGIDIDSLTGHGVAALACGTFANFKAAKADDLNFVALPELFDDEIEDGIDCNVCIPPGKVGRARKSADKLSLIQCMFLRL